MTGNPWGVNQTTGWKKMQQNEELGTYNEEAGNGI